MVLIAFEMEKDLRERAEMSLVADQNKRHAKSAARIADLASKLQDERVKREAAEQKLSREYEEKKNKRDEEDLSDEEEDDNTSMRRSLFRESLRSRGRSLSEEYGNIARRADKLEESISNTFSMARNLTERNEIDLKDHKTFLKQIREDALNDTSFPLDENEDEVDEDDPTRTLAIRELHALRAMIDEVDSLTDLYENFDRTVASSSLNVPLKSFSPRKSKRRKGRKEEDRNNNNNNNNKQQRSFNSSFDDSLHRSSDGSLMRVKAYDSHGNLVMSVRNSRRFDGGDSS